MACTIQASPPPLLVFSPTVYYVIIFANVVGENTNNGDKKDLFVFLSNTTLEFRPNAYGIFINKEKSHRTNATSIDTI